MVKISCVGGRHGDLGGESLVSLYRQMRLIEWNGRCKVTSLLEYFVPRYIEQLPLLPKGGGGGGRPDLSIISKTVAS